MNKFTLAAASLAILTGCGAATATPTPAPTASIDYQHGSVAQLSNHASDLTMRRLAQSLGLPADTDRADVIRVAETAETRLTKLPAGETGPASERGRIIAALALLRHPGLADDVIAVSCTGGKAVIITRTQPMNIHPAASVTSSLGMWQVRVPDATPSTRISWSGVNGLPLSLAPCTES